MGSIEVYDAKQEKWVPYVPDYDAWYQHFKDLRDGYIQPDHMGLFCSRASICFSRASSCFSRASISFSRVSISFSFLYFFPMPTT